MLKYLPIYAVGYAMYYGHEALEYYAYLPLCFLAGMAMQLYTDEIERRVRRS